MNSAKKHQVVPTYKFKMTKTFRKKFDNLSSVDKKATKEAFELFRKDPFDSRLRPHKVPYVKRFKDMDAYSIWVRGNLRVIFTVIGNDVISLDVGNHDIYHEGEQIEGTPILH